MKSKSFFRVLSLSCALLFGIVSIANANPNPRGKGWKKLGNKSINGKVDQDCINLAPWAGRLKAIQLTTNDDRININKVVIYFTNGGRQIVDLRKDWRGGESHIIVLKGGGKRVDRVVYWGSKIRGNHRNRHHRREHIQHNREVMVWGLRSNGRYDRDNRDDRYGGYDDYRYDRDRSCEQRPPRRHY